MTDIARARALVLRHGWNATAYQIVNPGIEHWFSSNGDAAVGFVKRHGVFVVAGAPVCSLQTLPEVTEEWEAYAARQAQRVCYFGAAERLHDLIGSKLGYSTVVLGAQPVWQPKEWSSIIAGHASLRAQLNRARNKGIVVCEWESARASGHPQLQSCLSQWLSTRGLPPLQFLVEPRAMANMEGRRIFVAESGGEVVGFLNAAPVPARRGWLTEQFVRGTAAPNGTIEALVDAMMRAINRDGALYATMGVAPLSSRHALCHDPNPPWLRALLAWVRAHGHRFYNFEGLEAFKSKLQPHGWEPIYAISSEPRFSPGTLYALASAFSGQGPLRALAHGLIKAGTQEWRWLIEAARRSDGL
jgi:phosphatidylglycerol lysyltransferase